MDQDTVWNHQSTRSTSTARISTWTPAPSGGMDAADRVGIAEAKHITGMYKFLDDMRADSDILRRTARPADGIDVNDFAGPRTAAATTSDASRAIPRLSWGRTRR